MRNAAFTALVTSLLLALAGISLAVSERARTSARLDQRLALQADGEANAIGAVFVRSTLALRLLAGDTAFREGIRSGGPGALHDINLSLGSLEHADPGVVGAASAIGLDGRERARVVRGIPAPAAALAHDDRSQAFFRATLATRPGSVHVSQPYRSADTGQLVVSSSTLVRDAQGAPIGIVRFELTLASVRAAATAALGDELGVQVALVDPSSDRAILDTTRGVLAWSAGAQDTYRALASPGPGHGAFSGGGDRLAFRALTGVPAGLGWVVVASSAQPSLVAAAGLSLGVAVLLAFSFALAITGLVSLRQRRLGEAQALIEAEGGRAEAERRTRTDALTGLYNRRHMLDAIAAELARSERTGVPPGVLMLDLDNFRLINDGYGRVVGDRVLAEVARRLRARLRGYDVVGRWDGEIFVALVPGLPDDQTLRTLADQLRRLVGSLPVAVDDDTLLPVTISVGAVRAGDALRSVEGLVDCAKRALAAAKRRGRDRVQLFGDLTVEDLVAEEPETLRLARALALSSSARAHLPQVDTERISELAAAISEQMRLGEASTTRCRLAGLLHDMGTVVVADRILSLVGPPLPRDWLAYEEHAAAGARMVRSVAGVSEAADFVGAHEERFDGTGYPLGLSGDDIPLESRIVACAAAYAKLARILSGEPLAEALKAQSGQALDPEVVNAALTQLARERSDPPRRLRDVPAT
ncbi:MAG TPA: diguanylate cyclase [Gaiellales bacterium]|jgi:diguanylate cyclase (GGDEF)-like protein|nr:diguanylate cyclase [Gaiellales bacterium]